MLYSYLNRLKKNQSSIKPHLDNLLISHHLQPVGNGYIDLIVTEDNLPQILAGLTRLGIVVEGVAMWCRFIPENKKKGCPHGFGGPRIRNLNGYFSEMCVYYDVSPYLLKWLSCWFTQWIVKKINCEKVPQVIFQVLEKHSRNNIQGCLVPSLWLKVPEEWKNQYGIS